MAYLKGGSVVDGNLYVEGGLVVRNIATSAGGQLPTLDEGAAKSDYLVKFINNNGALRYSSLKENSTGGELTLSTVDSIFNFKVNNDTDAFSIEKSASNTIEVSLNTSSNYITTVKDSTIYNEKGTEITKSFINGITEDTEISKIPESFKYSKE